MNINQEILLDWHGDIISVVILSDDGVTLAVI